MQITERDIVEWHEHSKIDRAEVRKQRDLEFDRSHNPAGYLLLHVNPYSFRAQKKPQVLLAQYGFIPSYSPYTPREISEDMFLEDIDADQDGFFTFDPGRLYLAYTTENVKVPFNEQWRFRYYFLHEVNWNELPLTTHLSAPWIQGGSRGPQTYEIVNESQEPLKVEAPKLACLVARFKDAGCPARVRRSGSFAVQDGQRPRLGTKFF